MKTTKTVIKTYSFTYKKTEIPYLPDMEFLSFIKLGISLLLFLFFTINLFSQNNSTAPDDFNKLCCKRSFVQAHEEPVAFTYLNQAGNMITYKTPDGKEANAYEIKAS